jgi:hypothetical protein
MGQTARKRRLARSDVLWWALAFVALQVGTAVLLDSWLATCRDPDYGFRRWLVRGHTSREPERPLLLALGTSRTLFGLRPDLIEGARPGAPDDPLVFNFGRSGYGVMHQYLELKRLLRDGVRPDALLLEFAPFVLGSEPGGGIDAIPVRINTWDDLADQARLRGDPRRVYEEWLISRSLPFFSYRFQILARFLPSWVPAAHHHEMTMWRGIDRLGWLRTTRYRPIDAGLAATKQVAYASLQELRICAAHARAMDELLNTCAAEKIPVVVVLMPESPVFRSWYGPETEGRIQEFLAGVRERHAVRIVDARAWLEDETLFHDGHHLDADGATAYTHRLAKEVLPHFGRLRHGAVAGR